MVHYAWVPISKGLTFLGEAFFLPCLYLLSLFLHCLFLSCLHLSCFLFCLFLPRATKATATALCGRKALDQIKLHLLYRYDNHLGDTLHGHDFISSLAAIPKRDHHRPLVV